MSLRHSLLLLACSAPLSAQNVLFEERFDQGIPRTWSQIQLGFGSDLWFVGTTRSPPAPMSITSTSATSGRSSATIAS